MNDRFVKTCLVLIVLLLVIVACRPLYTPAAALAANPIQYKTVVLPPRIASCEELLNALGKDGWQLVTTFADIQQSGNTFGIFKK